MKSQYLLSTGLLAGLALVASNAYAGDHHGHDHDKDGRADVVDPYAPVTPEASDEHIRTGIGVGISVGGGLMNYTDGALNEQTKPGGAWGARLTLGTRSLVAIEGAYVGTANDINGLGLDDDTVMTAHGAEGLLRLNFGTAEIQPYLFGGGAWKHYSLINNNNVTSSVANADNIIEVPFGAGIAFRGDGFVFDTRFDYRPAFDEEMFAAINGREVDLDNWNATARIGFEF